MDRARALRRHADWFLDLAARAGDGRMFQKLIVLAEAYQQRALDAERKFERATSPVLVHIDGRRRG